VTLDRRYTEDAGVLLAELACDHQTVRDPLLEVQALVDGGQLVLEIL